MVLSASTETLRSVSVSLGKYSGAFRSDLGGRPLHYIRRFLVAVGITALGVLALTGAPAVAASAPAGAATAQATAGPPQIYWANNATGTIARANLDGTGANQSFITGSPTSLPCGVAVDGGHIYWANSAFGTIARANLDGTGVDQNFITGAVRPCGVAVDQTHIYWEAGVADPTASSDHGVIGRANLDGTAVNQSFITSPGRPTGGLAVDGAHIYWTNFASSSIGRANLDGTGVDQHFIATAFNARPCGVAVDGAHVFWAEANPGTVARAGLDGTGVNENFITGDPGGPCGVAVDGTHVLFSNGATDGTGFFWIGRANLDGTGATTEFLRTDGAVGVAVSPPAAATPPAVPAAPVIGPASFGNASATVRWAAPASNGGSAITGYLVRVVDSAGNQVGALRPAAATATSLAVTGLANGASYRFQVAAANAAGTGPDSALSAVVVPATVPGAPVIAPAGAGTAGGAVTATAQWNPPASTGGSAVTGYRVRALRMSATGTVLATTTSAVQPGSARGLAMTLQAGNYRFTVQASNKAGRGPQSARSNLVLAQ